MKKFIIISTLLIILLSNSFADLNRYQFVFIKKIEIGKENGKIGYYGKAFGGMASGPVSITVTKQNEIIVPDYINLRLNVYDLNLNFIKTIIEKDNILLRSAAELYVDEDGNILGVNTGNGIKKIDKEGNTIFIKKWNDLNDDLKDVYHVFPKNKNYFYYKRNDEYACITSDGKFLNTDEAQSLIDTFDKQDLNTDNSLFFDGEIKKSYEKLQKYRKDKKHIILGNIFFDSRYSRIKEFYENTIAYYKYIRSKENVSTNAQNNIIFDQKVVKASMLVGYDTEYNSYWNNPQRGIVSVVSNTGVIIDALSYDELKDAKLMYGESIKVAVAPSGDVYFMRNDETGSYFWKVLCRW